MITNFQIKESNIVIMLILFDAEAYAHKNGNYAIFK